MLSLDQLVWVLLMILVNHYSNRRIIDNVLNSQSFMTEHFGTLSLFHFRMWIYFSFIKCCLHLISTKAAKLAISKKLSFGYSICIFLLCLSLTCSRNLPDDSTSTTLGSPAPVETNKYASVSFLIIDFTMTDAKIFQLKANRKGILHGREESFQYL